VSYWFRLRTHPGGPLPHYEFAVDDDLVYPRVFARGTRRLAWFEIDDGFVYATEDHPERFGDRPWYEIVGSFLYPAEGHPEGACFEPRYQARPTPD
jgi:hypothetical protein